MAAFLEQGRRGASAPQSLMPSIAFEDEAFEGEVRQAIARIGDDFKDFARPAPGDRRRVGGQASRLPKVRQRANATQVQGREDQDSHRPARGQRSTGQPQGRSRTTLRMEIHRISRQAEKKRPDIAAAGRKASQLLKPVSVKRRVCEALRSVGHDAFDISKVLTPALLALSVAGKLTVAINPLVVAFLALVLARMGVAVLCAEFAEPAKRQR